MIRRLKRLSSNRINNLIKYTLSCDKEHIFEGWFSSSSDYDDQSGRGLVSCPSCNSIDISKTLMTPSVSTGRKGRIPATIEQTEDTTSSQVATLEVPEKFTQVMDQMRALRDHVKKSADDVGDKFSEEARKIHYGETEKRGIYGQASPGDVKELIDEGVEILPLPILPEDKN